MDSIRSTNSNTDTKQWYVLALYGKCLSALRSSEKIGTLILKTQAGFIFKRNMYTKRSGYALGLYTYASTDKKSSGFAWVLFAKSFAHGFWNYAKKEH